MMLGLRLEVSSDGRPVRKYAHAQMLLLLLGDVQD